jgi:hypothetical protein
MSEEKEKMLTLSSSVAGAPPDFGSGSIFFVGTATVILRYAGFTVLTDPNFLHAGDHVHLGYGLTAERLTNPALEIEDLPPLDFCVLSHYHGDHFDRIAEERLQKDLPIITTEHAASNLKEKNFTAPIALDTWDAVTITKGDARVRITSMPGKHGPAIVDAFLPPVMGSMLEFQNAAGQTALQSLHHRRHARARRFAGDTEALSRDRPRPLPSRRHADHGNPFDDGRRTGRGSHPHHQPARSHSHSLQRL